MSTATGFLLASVFAIALVAVFFAITSSSQQKTIIVNRRITTETPYIVRPALYSHNYNRAYYDTMGVLYQPDWDRSRCHRCDKSEGGRIRGRNCCEEKHRDRGDNDHGGNDHGILKGFLGQLQRLSGAEPAKSVEPDEPSTSSTTQLTSCPIFADVAVASSPTIGESISTQTEQTEHESMPTPAHIPHVAESVESELPLVAHGQTEPISEIHVVPSDTTDLQDDTTDTHEGFAGTCSARGSNGVLLPIVAIATISTIAIVGSAMALARRQRKTTQFALFKWM